MNVAVGSMDPRRRATNFLAAISVESPALGLAASLALRTGVAGEAGGRVGVTIGGTTLDRSGGCSSVVILLMKVASGHASS